MVSNKNTLPILDNFLFELKDGVLKITAANPGDSYMLVACFAAVSALFVLPTYPTLVAAVQMDDTGTTRIGIFVFNHPFFIPGTLGVALAVCFGFVLGSFML